MFALLIALPLGAQRGRQQRAPLPQQTPPPKTDTSMVRKTPDGFVLDFQEQELRVVLSAIAEAGGLNLTLNNIPSKRITLRMGQAISKTGAVDVLRGVAESNALKMTEGPSLIRIEGTPATTNAQQLQQQQQTANATQLRLFTYRLKHASAVQLGPVLMNLLTGAGNAQQTILNQGPGGFQVLPQQTIQIPGRGGQPGQTINITPGRGGGPGGGGGGGGGGAANALQNIAQQMQQALFGQGGAGGGGALQNAQNIRIVAEESTNSLLVRATSDDWLLIQQLLATVDLRPLQVLIEVSIAQVSRTHDFSLGISGRQTSKVGAGADTAFMPTAASARDFIFALTGGKGAVSYSVALSALQTRGDVKILSLPLIIGQNNKEAILNVGQRVPFVQTSQTVPNDPTNRVSTVQYQDVGTTLTITPTINPDGYVNLAVKQTNNSATATLVSDAPIIDTREATTQIFIRDGQTTVIGGLSDNTRNNTQSGIPYLSRIPLIGWLFRNTTKNEGVSEFYLFLTPHIVSSDEDIDRLREAVRNGSDILQPADVQSQITTAVDSMKALPKQQSPAAPAPAPRVPPAGTPADTTRRRPSPERI
ncbi:MAG: secretin N-terminal domain-containing protein [Gemmatimonadota bacterium]